MAEGVEGYAPHEAGMDTGAEEQPRSLGAELVNQLDQMEGMVEPGNIDLTERQGWVSPQGGVAHVPMSVTFAIDDPKAGQKVHVVLPTLSKEGHAFPKTKEGNLDLLDAFTRSQEHLGKFKTAEAAEQHAQRIHDLFTSGLFQRIGHAQPSGPTAPGEMLQTLLGDT